MPRARPVALCGLVASLLAVAGCGSGKPHAGLVPAIRHYVATGCCVPMRTVVVDHVVYAPEGWAGASVRATTRSGVDLGGVGVIAHWVHGRWRVLELGSVLEGCGVPAKVVRVLDLLPCQSHKGR